MIEDFKKFESLIVFKEVVLGPDAKPAALIQLNNC